jgi:hypothetical protein
MRNKIALAAALLLTGLAVSACHDGHPGYPSDHHHHHHHDGDDHDDHP